MDIHILGFEVREIYIVAIIKLLQIYILDINNSEYEVNF